MHLSPLEVAIIHTPNSEFWQLMGKYKSFSLPFRLKLPVKLHITKYLGWWGTVFPYKRISTRKCWWNDGIRKTLFCKPSWNNVLGNDEQWMQNTFDQSLVDVFILYCYCNYTLSGLKQHKCITLQFWRSEVGFRSFWAKLKVSTELNSFLD